MAKSLQQQLLDAGLVDRKKLARHEQEKRQQARQEPKKGRKPEASAARRKAERAQAEKAARDRELNRERQQEAERKAQKAQLEQFIRAHRLSMADGDIDFRFVDRGVIKTVGVNPQQHRELVAGALALVRHRRTYALVPREIALKVAERDAGAVAVLNDGTAATADEAGDDAYAGYRVPDDLMW